MLFESLENRQVMAHPHAIYYPGTPLDYMKDNPDSLRRGEWNTGAAGSANGSGNFQAQDINRWLRTATNGGGLGQGDPTTITWSITPERTSDGTGGSNFIAFLDGIYGTAPGSLPNRPWFPLFRQVFDNYSALSGVNYVYEPNDDGANLSPANPGVLGVRGDVRIMGRDIDGNFGILGFNYFPDFGDMVIDTADLVVYGDLSNNSRILRNVLAHEAGHGLGIDHVEPIDQTKLLEPFLSTAFDGPQHDDLLAVNRLYGDRLEPNDGLQNAADLGTLINNRTATVASIAIDDDSDVDYFRFHLDAPALVNVDLKPFGFSYMQGPQGGTPSPFDSKSLSDLSLQLIAPDGTTVLSAADLTGIGGDENITAAKAKLPGDYFLRVAGANNAVQMYTLAITAGLFPIGPRLISVNPNDGELFDPDGGSCTIVGSPNCLDVGPREITFRFDGSQSLDTATLAGIRITRSVDGVFGNGDDQVLEAPQFASTKFLANSPRIVTARFAEPLPDDKYRIEVFGFDDPAAGIVGLRNTTGELFIPRNSNLTGSARKDVIDFELDLGAHVTAVVPQPITRVQTIKFLGVPTSGAFRVTFRDDTQPSKPVETTAPIPYNATAADVQSALEALNGINPGDVSVAGTGPWNVTFQGRFVGEQLARLVVDNGTLQGASVQVTTSLAQAGNQIVVYFNDDDLEDSINSAEKTQFYQLIFTNDTVRNTGGQNAAREDDQNVHIPTSVAYYPEKDKAVLTFASNVDLLSGAGSYRLRIGTEEKIPAPPNAIPVLTDPLSSFATATDLSTLGFAFGLDGSGRTKSVIIASAIEPQPYNLAFPGDEREPGHRDTPEDKHYEGIFGPDAETGITTAFYNFRTDYGVDPFGTPLQNAITAEQKQRSREIFELLSRYSGIRFIETVDRGMTIATGDPRAIAPGAPTGANGIDVISETNLGLDGRVILNAAKNWYDGFGDDENGSSQNWFENAMSGIQLLMGQGFPNELAPRTINGDLEDPNGKGQLATDLLPPNVLLGEPVFPGDHDISHDQHLFRPESKDIDLYRFTLPLRGLFSAETIAERLPNSSLLDGVLRLYRETLVAGQPQRELISQNNDYFSSDSYIEMPLTEGTYYIGVSASGNDEYDPTVEDSGLNGTSQGDYHLRLNFRPQVNQTIVDATGTKFDGDGNGIPGGVYNFWFRAQDAAHTRIVDKSAAVGGTGTLAAPYRSISSAFAAAQPGDLVRIVGNGGADGDLTTQGDNLAYEIGFGGPLNSVLSDGVTMEVPRGVTAMIDAGAEFKVRQARLGVGSSTSSVDRSGSALQVLGVPNQTVLFTSYNDETNGLDTNPVPTSAAAGDWGGLVFRDDVDRAQGRFTYDRESIFINYVNHADIRYGGGNVFIDGVLQVVNSVEVFEARPTITFNTITLSANAAISADPNSFEESNFHSPPFQISGAFTSDYDRIGPDVHGNRLVNNSNNGLFVRVQTPAGTQLKPMTVAGRFNDTDIVHIVSENLTIQGTPGGPLADQSRPPVTVVAFDKLADGTLPAGTYQYRLAFVDANGNEGPPSTSSSSVSITGGPGQGTIRLRNLPTAPAGFTGRRLYRSTGSSYDMVARLDVSSTTYLDTGRTEGGTLRVPSVVGTSLSQVAGGSLATGTYNYQITFVDAAGHESIPSDSTSSLAISAATPNRTIQLSGIPTLAGNTRRIYRSSNTGSAPYTLAAVLNDIATSYTDTGTLVSPRTLLPPAAIHRARLDARLAIDPSMIIKLEGSRIDALMGAQIIAEGREGQEIIFTTRRDDRFGASGTFDTNNDGLGVNAAVPAAGDWGGIIANHLSTLSIDHALITFGGGINKIEGTFAGFNAIEVHQAEARITHSLIENNGSGVGGQAERTRSGRGFNDPAAIFVRGSQPIIVDNIIRANADQSGNTEVAAISINVNSLNHERIEDYGRSRAEMDRVTAKGDNQGPLILENRLTGNEINGMNVRGGLLTTQGVWDDTDMVHVVRNDIVIPDFHTFGGLRLESSPSESLVIKLSGARAGFTATGRPLDIDDRIGGALQIIGQPGFPVVLTSLGDATVGAGFQPNGLPQTLTSGQSSNPQPGDWRSVRLDQFSHDRNIDVVLEREPADVTAPGPNATPQTAQFIGSLAPHDKAGDDNLRLGLEVQGFLTEPKDVDVYSFKADGGSEVWLDIDRTTVALDTVVELVDATGNLIARSDNSDAEARGSGPTKADPLMPAFSLDKSPFISQDRWTTNPHDAGLRVVLPGTPGVQGVYHVRVRSSGPNLDANLTGGLTRGAYQLQVRLRELDEIPGSSIRFADIRFATNGIEILGMPGHSQLLGEAVEAEVNFGANDSIGTAEELGNILNTDRAALSVAGQISPNSLTVVATASSPTLPGLLGETTRDDDWYRFVADYDNFEHPFNNFVSTVFDVDYSDGIGRGDLSLAVYDPQNRLILIGRDSHVADDLPAPLQGVDLDDLSRGTFGNLDPFIGPVYLPETDLLDQRYNVVVTSNARIPQELDQFMRLQATNPLVRLEPINSVERIAEDRVGFSGGSRGASAETLPILFDTASQVPFHLGDVTLFVSQNQGLVGNDRSNLRTVNAFTGQQVATAGSFNPPIGDIAMRGDGELFAFSVGPAVGNINDGNTGNYLQIDTGTAATSSPGDDGVETYIDDPMNPGNAIRPNNSNGFGMFFDAFTYTGTADFSGFAIGTRRDAETEGNPFNTIGPQYSRNILYNFNINSGVVRNRGGADDKANAALLTGAGTQKIELGRVLTHTEIRPQFVETGDTFTITISGESISYTAVNPFPSDVVAGLAAAWQTAALTVPEFAAFEIANVNPGFNNVLNARLSDPSGAFLNIIGTAANGGTSPFETITVSGFGPGGDITGMASLFGQLFAVTDQGGLFRVNTFGGFGGASLGTYIRTSAEDLLTGAGGGPISFAGLSKGPDSPENGRYASSLFGIDTSGRLHALNTQGTLLPVFADGQTSADTGIFNPTGLAFSTLDRNLWTTTGHRGTDVGHGVYTTFDDSRRIADIPGGSSLYFGNTIRGDGNRLNGSYNALVRNYNYPGGAHGTMESNSIDLSGYVAADQPVLYFNYFLDTEDTTYNPRTDPVNFMRDSFRVYVVEENGQSTLVGTNNTFQDERLRDEYDIGQNDAFCNFPVSGFANQPFRTMPCVQQVFDNTGGWRQARVPLDRFAGQNELRLRFEFSTAGSIDLGNRRTTGSELRARAGDDLRDGQQFQIDGRTFEFELGFTIVAPPGTGIDAGDSIRVNGRTLTFIDSGIAGPTQILFNRSQSPGEIAQSIAARMTTLGVTPRVNGDRVNLPTATEISLSGLPATIIEGAPGAKTGYPVFINSSMTRDQVALAIAQALADVFSTTTTSGAGTSTSSSEVEPNDSLATAQNVNGLAWSLAPNPNIGDLSGTNTSTTIPHLTLNGTGNASFDYYSFTVTNAGDRGIFDIDATSFAFDSEIFLFDSAGNFLAGNDDIFTQAGAGGSSTSNDSFLQFTFPAPGTYVIGVGEFNSVGAAGGISGNAPDAGDTYTLQFSIENHALGSTSYITSGSGGLDAPHAVAFGPDGNLYVSSTNTDAILQYDGTTGAFLGAFVPTASNGLDAPNGIAFGSDGNLYIASQNTNQILRFEGPFGLNPGAFIDVFAAGPTLIAPRALTFEATGNLLVTSETSAATSSILRIQGPNAVTPGAISTFIAPGTGGLNDPRGLAFGPDGNLYVTDEGTNSVLRFNRFTGQFLGNFATTGLDDPQGLLFGTDGALYVAEASTDSVLRFSGQNGGLLDVLASGGGLDTPTGLAFRPGGTGDLVVASRDTDDVHLLNVTLVNSGDRTNIKTYREMVRVINHTVTNQGPLGLEAALAGDSFGAFNISGPPQITRYPGAQSGMDNDHEGVHIDDIVIGFAERGEMVTRPLGSNAGNTNMIDNWELLNRELPDDHEEILVGEYQLEIRRGAEYGSWTPNTVRRLFPTRTIDTNDRLSQNIQLAALPGSDIPDGQTFTVSDGVHSFVFEFDNLNLDPTDPDAGVRPGNIQVGYNSGNTANEIAEAVRNAINSAQAQNSLNVTASLLDGTVAGPQSTSDVVSLSGTPVVSASSRFGIRGVTSPGTTFANNEVFSITNDSATESITALEFILAPNFFYNAAPNGNGPSVGSQSDQVGHTFPVPFTSQTNLPISFTNFTPGEQFVFGIDIFNFSGFFFNFADGASLAGTTVVATFSDGVTTRNATLVFKRAGNAAVLATGNVIPIVNDEISDSNIYRDQGQLLVHSNVIRDSKEFGVLVDNGARSRPGLAAMAGTLPHAGPTRSFDDLNTDRFAPGPVIANNLIVNNQTGGIRFSGDSNITTPGAVPFGRIVNNTLYGRASGDTGVLVDQNASPTLLNNIVSNFSTGIRVDASSASTVIGTTLYNSIPPGQESVGPVGIGSFAIIEGASPFVNAAGGNFYLRPGTRAIDSSLDSLDDRADYAGRVRAPLGIAPSPILAPDRDVLGQLRVDDPRVSPPAGLGANVFKDRGAIDRADFSGLTAELLSPRDNDALGKDVDPNPTVVQLVDGSIRRFEILLVDGEGTGPDGATVSSDTLTLTQDGVLLYDGTDYVFGYNATSHLIRLTPLSGIWRPGSAYVITLNNRDRIVINAPAGDAVADGETFTITNSAGVARVFEFESGFSIQVPQTFRIQVPVQGTASGGITDGQRFIVGFGATSRTFEFNSNTVVGPGVTEIPISTNNSQNQLADIIVAALAAANLGLSPRNLGNGAIHVGSLATHVLDVSASGLTQSGQAGGAKDGDVVTITNGALQVIFELDDNAITTSGNTVVTAIPGMTLARMTHEEIANRLAAAIGSNANAGLPRAQHLEKGLVHLGGTTSHTLDTLASNLTQSGTPGVSPGAQAVPFLPFSRFTSDQMAGALINAINAAGLTGVTSSLRGGSTVFVNGATSIQGITNFFLPAIKDIAGNPLQPNQPTGSTQFTILLPGVILDFGDAPEPSYATTLARNGARHVLLESNMLRLGANVDDEKDGQPNANATGDGSDDDGVRFGFFTPVGATEQFVDNIFTPGFGTNLTVTASDTGYLDAWIDFNQDGDWDDPGEKVIHSALLSAGRVPNQLTPGQASPLQAFTPTSARLGTTVARFRFSPLGGLFPTGIAVGGEVEDYQVRVISNDPPTLDQSRLTAINSGLSTNRSREDDPDRTVSLANLFNDVDITNGNGDSLTLSIVSSSRANVISPSINGTNLLLDFLPDKNDGGSPIVLIVRATDHGGRSVDANVTIPVEAVNDAPTITLPAAQTVTEDVARTIIGLIVDDVDAEESPTNKQIIVTLHVDHGTLTLRTDVVGGLLPANIAVNGTADLQITATPSAIKATLAAAGGLVYTPNLNYNGPDGLVVSVTDQGHFGLGGTLTAGPVTMSINVLPVNDAPVWNTPANLTALEDVRLSINSISLTDVDAGPNSVRVSLSINNGTLTLSTTGLLFTVGDGTNDSAMTFTGTVADINAALSSLSFISNPDVNGTGALVLVADDLGNAGAGGAKSDTRTVNLLVTAVNDAPRFTLSGPNQTLNEDAGIRNVLNFATNIQRGPQTATDEVSQTLQFALRLASADGNLAFTTLAINPATGTLTYQSEPDTNGKAVVEVTLIDDGGVANGGVDTSAPALFTITVNAVNDAPVFVKGPNVTVNEDAGLQQLISWATDIRKGPLTATDEDAQSLNFNINLLPPVSGNLQFSALPTIDPATGNLSFETTANTNGVAVFRVTLRDNGPGNSPNVNVSTSQTFTIAVNAVNDAPEYTKGPDITVDEDAGAQLIAGWATDIRRGPPSATDESGQILTFQTTIVSTTGNITFSSPPSVNPASGNLTFVVSPNANGTAAVSVTLVDSGSGLSPNVNSSIPQTLTITVNAVNDAPVVTVPGPRTVNEDVDLRLPPITVTDVDAAEGTGDIQVTLHADRGTLTVNPAVAGGVPSASITNNGSSTVTIISTPARVNATLAALDGLTYRGNLHFNGDDVLTVSADDLGNTGTPSARTGSATMKIVVSPVNDPPRVVNPIADITVQEDAARTVLNLVPTVFDDPDRTTNADTLSFTVTNNSNPTLLTPTISVTQAGTFLLLDYRSNQNGVTTITVRAQDQAGLFDTDTFNVTVTAVNDAPQVVQPIVDRVIDEDGANTTIDLGPVFGDADTATNSDVLSIISPPTNSNPAVATAAIGGTLLTIDYQDNQNGLVEISVTARDTAGLTATDTFVLTVREMNDPPIAQSDSQSTNEDIPLSFSSALLRVNDSAGPNNESSQTLSITAVSATSANGGSVRLNAGTITYTPALNFNGIDTFTYTVEDNGTSRGVSDPRSATGTVNVTVLDVNDPPVTLNDTTSGLEDTTLAIDASSLASNDQPGPADEVRRGQTLIVTAVEPLSAQGGTVIFDGVQVRYTPPTNFNGADTFVYTVSDNGTTNQTADPKTSTGTVTVNVAAINDPPVANDDSQTSAEDTALAINSSALLANDSPGPANENNQAVTVVSTSSSSAAGGTATLNSVTRQIVYSPPGNFNGVDTFTYTVQDDGVTNGVSDPRTAIGTVSVTVTTVNDRPVPVGDTKLATEDVTLRFQADSLTVNDSRGPANESGQSLSVTSVSATSNNGGNVSLDASTGQVTFTPAANFNGVDQFTYVVTDNGTTNGSPSPQSATGTVTVTVAPVNDPPTAVADRRTIAEDSTTAFNATILLNNDSVGPADEAGQTLTVTAVASTSTNGGSATLVGGTLSYSPPANFNGVDTLAYTVTDNGQSDGVADPRSANGTISFTITPVNDPPVAANDSTSTAEDAPYTFVPAELTANDLPGPADEISQVLSLASVSATSSRGGSITFDSASGRYTYSPPANFNGVDTFTYTVRDNGQTNGVDDPRSSSATVSITLTASNDRPVAVNDTYNSNEDSTLQVAGRGVLANDFDIDVPAETLSVSFFNNRSALGAAVNVNFDGTFSYDPAGVAEIRALRTGQVLRDTFSYRISDGNAESVEATVTINVEGINDAPLAVDDLYSIAEDRTLTVGPVSGVRANDSDPETDPSGLNYLRVSGPSHGTLTFNLDGSFSYAPNPNFNGLDSFTYRANDGLANSNVATVQINVTAENDAPLTTNDSYRANANAPLTINAAAGVLRNDGDPEGSALTAQLVSNASHGSVSLNADGSFIYTPSGGFTGTDTFTYRARDVQGALANVATVTITVERNAPWQNIRNSLDVNADGSVSPIDALVVVNRLNQFDAGPLPAPGSEGPPPFYDVNGDNQITPLDALMIINFLNGSDAGEGEDSSDLPVGAPFDEMLLPQLVLPDYQQDPLDSFMSNPQQQASAARRLMSLSESPGAPQLLASQQRASRADQSVRSAIQERSMDALDEVLEDLLNDDSHRGRGKNAADRAIAELFG